MLAAAAAAIVFSLFSALAPTSLDNYVLLADAWLHGHLWVAHLPGPWIDAMPYHGRYYIIEAPAPAILLLPFVAIFGTSTNQTVLGVALAAISAFGVWRLSEYLGLSRWLSVLLVAFLSFGTSLGFCAAYGAVWFVAHLSAVAFTMLALAEIYGSERGWVVSLWAVLAALSRYPLILALPVYAVLLYLRTRSTSVLFGYCALLIPAVVAYAAYNYARWGTLLDGGFTLWYKIMDPRSKSGRGPFDVHNVDYQLRAFFATAPIFSRTFPWVRADDLGLSLTWTSPALVVAALARHPVAEIACFWTLTILTALPAFLYYDLGGFQLGMRHSLDFAPFLLILIMFALREARGVRLFAVLASYSIAFGFYQLVIWKTLPL